MNEEIKVLIVEDEDLWLKNISATLHDFGYTVSGTADSFESAVELFNNTDFDIVLLDIGLDGKNKGIDLGKMLHTLYKKPFIFITATPDNHTLGDAMSAGPSAYLTKPVHPSSLIATLQSAINAFQNKQAAPEPVPDTGSSFFFVKQGNKYKKVEWAKVIYLRSDKNYTIICSEEDNCEYFIRSTLSKTMNFILPAHIKSSFVQINRAEAVHTKYILDISGEEIRTPYKTLTLTETYTGGLRKAINLIT